MIFFSFSACGTKKRESVYVYGTSAFVEKQKELKYSIYDAAERCADFLWTQDTLSHSSWLQLDIIYGNDYIFKTTPAAYNLKLAEYYLSGIWIDGQTGEIKEVEKGGKIKVVLEYPKYTPFVYRLTKHRSENRKVQLTDKYLHLPVKHIPIIDSTNFDNFEALVEHDRDLLLKIKAYTGDKEISHVGLNYRIPLAGNFTSVVVTYQLGEHELVTSLLTIDDQDGIIDKLDIAYDEIAESAFRTTSVIHMDSICITKWNYMGNEPMKEREIFRLKSNGKFERIDSK